MKIIQQTVIKRCIEIASPAFSYGRLALLSTSNYLFNLYRCICIKRICSNCKRKEIGVISF